MIDSMLNLLFRCPHRRLTRPVTPVGKDDKVPGETYVVCLDCGKQFHYDLNQMRVGKPLATSPGVGVLPEGLPGPHRSKLKLAIMAVSLPLGIAIGSLMTAKRQRSDKSLTTKAADPAEVESKPGETSQ
jgi:hypothetical protein